MSYSIEEYLNQSAEVLKEHFKKNSDIIGKMGTLIVNSLKNGGKLIVFGNGGSAADAQHMVCELVGSFMKKDRRALPAMALTVNSSSITSISNDFGYEMLFTRQMEGLGKVGDIALGISTSGNSKNVNLALKKAKEMGITTMGFSGKNGGDMEKYCDISLIVPSNSTPHIQEAHIATAHAICAFIEEEMS